MTTTPAMPASTAAQRQGPTRSPRNGTESAVMNSGATKKIAAASAKGMAASARK